MILSLHLAMVVVSVFLVNKSTHNIVYNFANIRNFCCTLQNGWKMEESLLTIKQNLELKRKLKEGNPNHAREYSIVVQKSLKLGKTNKWAILQSVVFILTHSIVIWLIQHYKHSDIHLFLTFATCFNWQIRSLKGDITTI